MQVYTCSDSALNKPMPAAFRKSVFVACPGQPSNAYQAVVEDLAKRGYDGVVFLGTRSWNGVFVSDESRYVWEDEALRRSDVVLLWHSPEREDIPTAVRFAQLQQQTDAHAGKLVFGQARDREDRREDVWLRKLAAQRGIPTFFSLATAIDEVLRRMGKAPDERKGPETLVPLEVWYARHFQEWYRAQCSAGHSLEDVQRIEWTFRVGQSRFPLYFALHVSMRVNGENRVKSNEVVIIRPSISATCIFSRADGAAQIDDRIVLVKEYRTSVVNSKGFVYELAGGASLTNSDDALQMAIDEVKEETGITVAREKCRVLGKRQIASTMVANQALLVGVEISNAEMDAIEALAGSVHGNMAEESERTYLCVMTSRAIEESDAVDWAVRGMIATALQAPLKHQLTSPSASSHL